jgi:hypothetical protein
MKTSTLFVNDALRRNQLPEERKPREAADKYIVSLQIW